MRLQTKVGLTVIATVTSVLAVGLPAAAQPNGTITNQGNLCILDEQNLTGYCVNLPDGNNYNGAVLQNWARGAQGEPENDWTQYKVGTVTSAGGGYPWPSGLIENGSGRTYDSIYSGKWVVMEDYSPYNTPTNYCMAEETDSQNGNGHAVGWTCGQTSLDQLWVSTGTGAYINVRGTEDTSENGSVGYMVLEGSFENGGEIGIEVGVESAYEDYHWYRRFGT